MIGAFLRKRLHRPEALQLIGRDLIGRRMPALDNRVHLVETVEWILRAQAVGGDPGISAGYSFEDGWVASYPETTGYTIPTLLAFGEYAAQAEVENRALAMADWLIGVQRPEGGFPGHFTDRVNPPVVFNTGQIIFGLLAAHEFSGASRFLEAARRAAAWLIGIQDDDGAWRRFDYLGTVHVYNTRTAWALVELGLLARDRRMIDAGRHNLDWALRRQQPNGWFLDCSFRAGEDPFLHTIAYTTQGLLEAGLRLKEGAWIHAAERACRSVLDHMGADGSIPGTFDRAWHPTARYSCLTGNAQMAVQWLRLYEITGDRAWANGARRALRFLKTLHDCQTRNAAVRGAVKGSHPIWGRYLFGSFPNWAAKFFADALLLDETLQSGAARLSWLRCW